MSAETPTSARSKKSVALSGVVAANTALCTVGRTGNDLHYRGYDILDVAETCEFEEIAHLLVHERLPTSAELAAYRKKLKSLRELPEQLLDVLEAIPASAPWIEGHYRDEEGRRWAALDMARLLSHPSFLRIEEPVAP